MPRKKKAAGDANESKWVTEPEAAPAGKPFCDVAYEHRCHSEPIEVLGVTFVPGQIVTYKSHTDVPLEFVEHPELIVRDVPFGVCRIDPMFRYTPLTLFAFEVLRARGTVPRFEEVAADGDQSEPEPLPDAAEPEGGE